MKERDWKRERRDVEGPHLTLAGLVAQDEFVCCENKSRESVGDPRTAPIAIVLASCTQDLQRERGREG